MKMKKKKKGKISNHYYRGNKIAIMYVGPCNNIQTTHIYYYYRYTYLAEDNKITYVQKSILCIYRVCLFLQSEHHLHMSYNRMKITLDALSHLK